MSRQLVVIAGPDKGRTFPLHDVLPLLVGRGRDTETRLKDPNASRVRCKVQVEGGHVVVLDRGSTGGILVNGKRVAQQIP